MRMGNTLTQNWKRSWPLLFPFPPVPAFPKTPTVAAARLRTAPAAPHRAALRL